MESVASLREHLRVVTNYLARKIRGEQRGVAKYFDSYVSALVDVAERLQGPGPWPEAVVSAVPPPDQPHVMEGFDLLVALAKRLEQPRRVPWESRVRAPGAHCEIGPKDFILSQGVLDCPRWRGLPLFKSAFDFAIYSMLLWNLKPATVIEVGSGGGASAAWLADLLRAYGIDARVYSIDLSPPDVVHPGVTFLAGDCNRFDRVLDEYALGATPHPWLVIEDAHVNVAGVLASMHPYTKTGDYVVVEDSKDKQNELGRFLAARPGCYEVDTYYTDFFGRNVTSAVDSILVRTSCG